MSNGQQHDVETYDLIDIEEILKRDNQLANSTTHPRPPDESIGAIPHAPLPSSNPPDADTAYERDIAISNQRSKARRARRRRKVLERWFDLVSLAEQQPTVPEGELGHFFPDIPGDQEDFGMNRGLILGQRM